MQRNQEKINNRVSKTMTTLASRESFQEKKKTRHLILMELFGYFEDILQESF